MTPPGSRGSGRGFSNGLRDAAPLLGLGTTLAVTVLAGVWGLLEPWQPVRLGQFGRLAAASVFLSGGYYLLTSAMRAGEMSVIAPFRYVALVFALVLGFAVWGDVPDALAWTGLALIVGAGVAVLRSR